MKRKFALPVIAALILHAALLLGFGDTPELVSGEGGIEPGVVIGEIPPTIEMVDYADSAQLADEQESVEQIEGNPEAAPVALPDYPRPAPVGAFRIPIEQSAAIAPVEWVRIKPGIRGVINGDPDGVPGARNLMDAGMLDSRPRAIVQTAPVYPGEARIQGAEGRVLVGFTVDEAGRVVSAYVITRTDRQFEKAAIRAVSKWRFEPGRRHGRVVRFRMAVPIIFSLND